MSFKFNALTGLLDINIGIGNVVGPAGGATINQLVIYGNTAGTSISGVTGSGVLGVKSGIYSIVTSGNLSRSAPIVITGGSGSILGTGAVVSITQVNATTDGYLSAATYNTLIGAATLNFVQSITSNGVQVTLLNDSASPGNFMLYGTNGSGTKGWYNEPVASARGDLTSPSPFQISGGSSAVWGNGTTINMFQVSADSSGWISNTQFNALLTGASTANFLTGGNTANFLTGGNTSNFLTGLNTSNLVYTFSTGLTATANTVSAWLSTGLGSTNNLYGGTVSGGTLNISSTTNGTKGLIIFGTSAYDEVNNRLGIGTVHPDAALEVTGSGISYFDQGLVVNYLGGATTADIFQVKGDTDDNMLYCDSNSNNIGIGTATPAYKLDVNGIVRGLNYISSVTGNTQPYATATTQVNTSLNADLLDGHHWAETGASVKASFGSANVSGGTALFSHSATNTVPYAIIYAMFNSGNQHTVPDSVTCFPNYFCVGLTSFVGAISGTWSVIYSTPI